MRELNDGRLPSLDGWRAIAIGLVLLSHSFAANGAPEWTNSLVNLGDFGVRIFFVLSGFLITLLLLTEHQRSGSISIRAFYMRRALRILPVYYLYLAVIATLQALSLYEEWYSSWLGSLTFTRNMMGQGDSATAHLWSLAVEEQFYLVWPAVLVALRLPERWRLALVLLAGILLMAFFSRALSCSWDSFICQRVLGPRSAIRYADSLAAGCAGAFLYLNSDAASTFWRGVRPKVLYVTIVLLAMSVVITPPTRLFYATLVTAQAIAVMGCIWLSVTARDTALFRALNTKPLVYMGLISYSLYIWHVLFLSHFVHSPLGDSALHHHYVWWIVSVAVAAASYFLFERPILRLRYRLLNTRWISPSRPDLAVTRV